MGLGFGILDLVFGAQDLGFGAYVSLRVQVPNNHLLTQNLYYNHYYPKTKYLIVGYLDPVGLSAEGVG